MFSFFNSFAASTLFEKYRLEITAKNFDAPDQTSLRNMMRTFCSEDTETKAQIAFATILKKLLTSDSKQSWVYILKNLVILDRVIEEGLFTDEVSELGIDTIDNYKETDKKYENYDSQRIIKTFWRLIKEKARTLSTKKHIFCYKRSQRQQYLSALIASETLKQIISIQNFFQLTFQLVDVLSGKKLMQQKASEAGRILKTREQFTKSKLLQYIYLQILHKFMLYYSCQLLCNNYFLQLLIKYQKEIKTEQIRRFRKSIISFKTNADNFIKFIEKNKKIKGFEQINYKELNPYHREEVLKIIDKLLYEDEKVDNQHYSNVDYRGSTVLRVEKKPSAGNSPGFLVPRIKFKKQSNLGKLSSVRLKKRQSKLNTDLESPLIDTNPFKSWINFYSPEFPPQQVMTVELITLLKKQKQNESEDQVLPDVQREANLIYYDLRETNISVNYQVNLKSEQEEKHQVFFFKNIYSEIPSFWNQS